MADSLYFPIGVNTSVDIWIVINSNPLPGHFAVLPDAKGNNATFLTLPEAQAAADTANRITALIQESQDARNALRNKEVVDAKEQLINSNARLSRKDTKKLLNNLIREADLLSIAKAILNSNI
jgi:hypothetical protein